MAASAMVLIIGCDSNSWMSFKPSILDENKTSNYYVDNVVSSKRRLMVVFLVWRYCWDGATVAISWKNQ
jgi:Pyruvate/2-oxoacid:ferredoxin oxidoreductase delta subunit